MEHLYAAYLLSGIIKSFLNYYNLSLGVDFTFLTGLLVIICVVMNVFNKRGNHKISQKSIMGIYALGLFYLWMNITTLYSLSSYYSYKKSFLFLTNVLAFVCPLLYRQFDIIKFLKSFMIISLFLEVLFLALYAPVLYSSSGSEQLLSGLYLAISEICGLCLLILFIYDKLFSRILDWFFIVLNSVAIILMGGRGPIIFVATVLIVFVISQFLIRRLSGRRDSIFRFSGINKIMLLGIFMGFTLFLLINFSVGAKDLFERSKGRLSLLFPNSQGLTDVSAIDRVDQFMFSIDLIVESSSSFFFGHGLGSYSLLYGFGEGRAYPHNILLEIWVETGFIGLLIFSCFLIAAYRQRFVYNPFTWCIIYLFLNTLKSNSIVDLRVFFGFVAIFILSSETMRLPRSTGVKITQSQNRPNQLLEANK